MEDPEKVVVFVKMVEVIVCLCVDGSDQGGRETLMVQKIEERLAGAMS